MLYSKSVNCVESWSPLRRRFPLWPPSCLQMYVKSESMCLAVRSLLLTPTPLSPSSGSRVTYEPTGSGQVRAESEHMTKWIREYINHCDFLQQANLVAAFEQSLALMTTRLQSLSMSHEQKVISIYTYDFKTKACCWIYKTYNSNWLTKKTALMPCLWCFTRTMSCWSSVKPSTPWRSGMKKLRLWFTVLWTTRKTPKVRTFDLFALSTSVCPFFQWPDLKSSDFIPRSPNASSELLWEHLQSQQFDQHVQYWQPEGPGCQEEEKEKLGKICCFILLTFKSQRFVLY